MRLLCRYVGGLACLVAVLALVACGAGPGSTKTQDPVGFKNIEVRQGSTSEISLVNTFSGSELTYKATSDKPSVATVTVDNEKDTLTVTAVGPGTATIKVTATDPQERSHSQDFIVTVPKPPADPVDILDITSLEEDVTRRIPLGDKFSGANLTYRAESSNERVATVAVAAATLTVTAVGPGTATITVTATAQGSAPQTKTFTVTVPQPADEEVAPTVRTGAITSVDVAQGGTQTVTLSTVFDGANLSYDVSSSPDTVATASVSSGILTITAVSIGPATITIVATNDAGDATHQIEVTVTAPVTTTPETPTPTTSDTLTLEIGSPSAKLTLAAGQTLESPPGDGVTVEHSSGETGNVWFITAKKKGIHTVTILSAGKPTGTITVKVPNRPPVRQDGMSNPNITLTEHGPDLNTDIYLSSTGAADDLDDYFSDPDPEDEDVDVAGDELSYRIENKPSWFLIETEEGFVKDANGTALGFLLSYEVLQEVKPSNENSEYEFTVSLHASDREDESTRPVVIEFNVDDTLSIRSVDYNVDQDTTSGNFRDRNKDGAYNNRLEIGPRREVPHKVIFDGVSRSESMTGFVFIENAHAAIPQDDRANSLGTLTIYYRNAGTADKVVGGTAGTIPSSYQVPGTRYLLVRGSGAVVVEGDAAGSITSEANPEVAFSLKSSGSGSIIIDYKVWLKRGAVSRDHDDDPSTLEILQTTATEVASRTLQVSVVTCNSPPNLIKACP